LDFLNADRDLEEEYSHGAQHKKGPSKKRLYKDERYGSGKKKVKKNTKDSLNDVSSFFDGRTGGSSGGKKIKYKKGVKVNSKNGAAKRLGKNRRKKQ